MKPKDYWEDRWAQHQTGWDIGFPSPALCKFIDTIEDKDAAILIPGCGNAYEAGYLLSKGFNNVTVIDIAATAVAHIRNRYEGLTVLHQDFFDHQGQYDYILEQTFFCALPSSLREAYVNKMHDLLKEEAVLAGLLFDVEFEKEGPPFGGSKVEYISLFSEKFEIIELNITNESIQPRSGSELFFRMSRK